MGTMLLGSAGSIIDYGAINAGLNMWNQSEARSQANRNIDFQTNMYNTNTANNLAWQKEQQAQQQAYNESLMAKQRGWALEDRDWMSGQMMGIADMQRGWQLEDRDWMTEEQQRNQSELQKYATGLNEQSRQQYLADVAGERSFWQQNAYPSDEKVAAMEAANRSAMNATAQTAERKFFDDASSRGLKGGAVQAGMSKIATDSSQKYKEMVNALTQFKLTPQWTPPNTFSGYQNMQNPGMASYPSAGSYPSVNTGSLATQGTSVPYQSSYGNYPTYSGLTIPTYPTASSGITNTTNTLAGLYLGNQNAKNSPYYKDLLAYYGR